MAGPERTRPGSGGDAEDPLVRPFLQGDRRAVSCVESMVVQVVRFRGYYVPAGECRDLVQQVLLDLCEALRRPRYSITHDFAALVRSVAHRRCVDWLRRQRPQGPIDPRMPAPDGRPDEAVAQEERRRLAAEILDQLPEPCRKLIALRLAGALSYKEIAGIVGRSEGALRFQMYQCLKHARSVLGRRLKRAGTAGERGQSLET